MTQQSEKRLPLRRLQFAFNRLIKESIPTNLDDIQRRKQLIEEYRQNQEWDQLMREQINGLQSVQRLKSDLRELESLTDQVIPEDYQQISEQIGPIKTNICEVVQQFLESNKDINNPLLGLEIVDNSGSDCRTYSEDSPNYNDSELNSNKSSNLQIMSAISERKNALISWLHLNKELNDLNDIFNTLMKTLTGQKERINTIENNIVSAEQNVLTGTQHLSKASALKSAFVPITAGLLGGAAFGPIGMMAGFKFSGIFAAAVASVAGYSGAKYIQKKSITDEEFEMIAKSSESSVGNKID